MANCVKRGPQPKPWFTVPFDEARKAIFVRECSTPTEFDQLKSRTHYNAAWNAGHIQPDVRQTEGGTVVAFFDTPEQAADVPWALWSRILQLFKRPDGAPYTIFFCAHPAPRTFPERTGETVKPLHINGGYTYPCEATCVFVYRAEDATRVLLHELFHAACSDAPHLDTERREAETEAWAELMWCAFMAGGTLHTLESLVAKQARWMAAQNHRLREGAHMEAGATGFPWRYTIGKEDVWRRWGLTYAASSAPKAATSLRLTMNPTAAMKQREGVRPRSTIL